MDWINDIFDSDYEHEDDLQTNKILDSPKISVKKSQKREFINGLKKQALNDLIPELPPTDVDLYVIGNGSGAEIKHGINPLAFDFGTFIPHIVELLGREECHLYVSTWSMNHYHAQTIVNMLDNGKLANVTVLTDPYFKQRESAVCNMLISGLLKHAPRGRFLAFKNHVKAICVSNSDKTRFCTITGSANLSSQPRCEQYIMTTAPEVYAFFVNDFFEAMIEIAHAKRK